MLFSSVQCQCDYLCVPVVSCNGNMSENIIERSVGSDSMSDREDLRRHFPVLIGYINLLMS